MKDPKTGRIVLKKVKDGVPLKMTSHRLVDFKDHKACEKCHFKDNRLGAPIRILPAKSLICIGCHSATVSAKDFISIVSLLLFLIGILLTLSYWFQGTVGDPSFSTHEKISYVSEKVWQTIFSRRVLTVLKVFVVDILFLRRILKESLSRWSVHSLIYLPFFLRFFIGLILLILSKAFPMSPAVALLLDKNHPVMAFTFDFLGLCIIIGIIGATMRRLQSKPKKALATGQDFVVLSLIGAILLTGFIVEGMRILLTGIPASMALSSFLGYPLSSFLNLFPIRWEVTYPYGWYLHALLTGALIAYLPFSKMFHILVNPLVFMIKAFARGK
jgi:nitrate reductase gamma subunit